MRNRSVPDFHLELLQLRKNWRLKKVGNSIIGDVSYRTGENYVTCDQMLLVQMARDFSNSLMGYFSWI